jgi:phage host-nuclease inhibitor protein Gam
MKGIKMELYKLTGEMLRAIQIYQDAETDQELENAERTLTALEIPFQEKAISVAYHILNTDADIVAIESELERLTALKNRAKKHNEWVRRYLQIAMEQTNTEEIKTATIKLKIQNNPPSVVIDDESLIPDSYKRIIPERKEIDKVAIKDAWKQNIGVNGTHIEQKKSLRIK